MKTWVRTLWWLMIVVVNFALIKTLSNEQAVWLIYIQLVYYTFFYYVIWDKPQEEI